jgi:23S rRNA pseudouridine2457 synthase
MAIAMLIAFNKPFGVICQFSPSGEKPTLKSYLDIPSVYPAGRLDTDSEGLVLLTNDGRLQARIASPSAKLTKTYWVQVEGEISEEALAELRAPLDLGDFVALPATSVSRIQTPALWERVPPVRFRATIPTSWLELRLTEGKNRQVRRMTAKIGFPTLRLVRVAIGTYSILAANVRPGEWQEIAPDALSRGDSGGSRAQSARKTP